MYIIYLYNIFLYIYILYYKYNSNLLGSDGIWRNLMKPCGTWRNLTGHEGTWWNLMKLGGSWLDQIILQKTKSAVAGQIKIVVLNAGASWFNMGWDPASFVLELLQRLVHALYFVNEFTKRWYNY